MSMAGISLVPRDGFFFKDGRGWYTSASGRGHGLDWPQPSTLRGALRTALGRVLEEKEGRTFKAADWRDRTAIALGPQIALRRPVSLDANGRLMDWGTSHRMWPQPADALLVEDVSGRVSLQHLDPGPPDVPTMGRANNEAIESLWRPRLSTLAKPLPLSRWWRESEFAAWLKAEAVSEQAVRNKLAPARRVELHVGISRKTLAAEEGRLYSNDVRESLEGARDPDGLVIDTWEWAIGCQIDVPGDAGLELSHVTIGADRRLSTVELLGDVVFEPPDGLIDVFDRHGGSKGLRLIAATPLHFEAGWLPNFLTLRDGEYQGRLPDTNLEMVLRAAYVGRAAHVSGWDMEKRRPKPTRRLVPTGSVYFFERCDGRPFGAADAEKLWLASIGCSSEEGFGRVVPGVWMPKGDPQ